MLYELIGIARPGNKLAAIRELVFGAGGLILENRGVIRALANWGVSDLPGPIRRLGQSYHQGYYFVMRFDSSVAVQQRVHNALNLDPRMLRCTTVRIGDGKLETIRHFGEIKWAGRDR